MNALSHNNKQFKFKEPFEGLFTQVWFVMKPIKIKMVIG